MCPYLEVVDPNGKKFKHGFENARIVIGRLAEANDIALESDPQKLITRYMHCAIEARSGTYWLIDNASKNGTFLKRKGNMKRIHGEERIQNQDFILILADIDSEGNPEYWEIKFIDPQATEGVEVIQDEQYAEYDWIQAKFFLVNGSTRSEIRGLSPQEHSLIRYMDQRNKNNNNIAVMCTYDELIMAIWEEFGETRTKNDVIRLIWGLRKKIEPDPENPNFLQNIKGLGYRLATHSGGYK